MLPGRLQGLARALPDRPPRQDAPRTGQRSRCGPPVRREDPSGVPSSIETPADTSRRPRPPARRSSPAHRPGADTPPPRPSLPMSAARLGHVPQHVRPGTRPARRSPPGRRSRPGSGRRSSRPPRSAGRPWGPAVRPRSTARRQCSKRVARSPDHRGRDVEILRLPSSRAGAARKGTSSRRIPASPVTRTYWAVA